MHRIFVLKEIMKNIVNHMHYTIRQGQSQARVVRGMQTFIDNNFIAQLPTVVQFDQEIKK